MAPFSLLPSSTGLQLRPGLVDLQALTLSTSFCFKAGWPPRLIANSLMHRRYGVPGVADIPPLGDFTAV